MVLSTKTSGDASPALRLPGVPFLAVDFPPHTAEWTFFVAAVVLLLGPLLSERIRLPGLVGIVLGGTLVGPFVLDWVHREASSSRSESSGCCTSCSSRASSSTWTSSSATAVPRFRSARLPFVLGLVLVLPFGYGLATALLNCSL